MSSARAIVILGSCWVLAACSGGGVTGVASGGLFTGAASSGAANNGSSTGAGSSTQGSGSSGQSTGSTARGSTSSGQSTGSTSQGNGSTTQGAAGSTTQSGTGGTCACSTACCSQQTAASSTRTNPAHCQDGKSCYGGWYCGQNSADTGTCSQTDPCNGQSGVWSCSATGGSNSSSNSGSNTGTTSGGATGGGATGASGGSASLTVPTLSFGAIGDTRPGSQCSSTSNCNYPTTIAQTLFSDMSAVSPALGFVIATGDFMYNTPGTGTAAWQVQQYLQAAQGFTGSGRPVYPTMGNHECDGYTATNCAGQQPTENLTAFLSNLLAPLGLPSAVPYYALTVTITAGQTAKFLFVAPNDWDSTQSAWLAAALQQPTTYTFIVQHEANNLDQSGASAPSSLSSIRSVIQAAGTPATGQTYPVTLFFVGHTHNYDYDAANQQVIIGLGGAGLGSQQSSENSSTFYNSNFAYLVCHQQSTGSPPAIQCTLNDYSTNVSTGQSFAVNADGTPATVQ